MAHHGVHVREPEHVPGHASDLDTKIAHPHAALASDSRVQDRTLKERELSFGKGSGMLQDDRDSLVRVERAEG